MSAAPNLHLVMTGKDADAGLQPPHDLEAEEAVISASLLDPTALSKLDFLHPEHFYSEKHRRIFEAARAVKAKGAAVDVTTVSTELKDAQRLNQVGGTQGILELLDASPAVSNVRDHGVIVFERWRLRAGQQLARRTMLMAYEAPSAQAYLDQASAAFADLARQQAGKKVETNLQTIRRVVSEMRDACVESNEPKRRRGMPSGIEAYDEMTLGLHPGQKTTVVAPPGVGKTVIGLQIAMSVSRSGVGAIMFSTEMSRDELADRQISSVSEVDSRRIALARQKPTLTPAEWSRLTQNVHALYVSKPKLAIHDDSSVTVEDICSRARAYADDLAAEGIALGVVVVDYVQRLRPSAKFDSRRNVNKFDVVSHSTTVLRNLAEELGVAVVELAQQKNLNDGKGSSGKNPKPKLGDAADSIQIEREAHNVLYLWRPNERDKRSVTGLLVKQRAGETGEFEMTFEGEFARFRKRDTADEYASSRQYVPGHYDGDGRW